MGNPGLVRSELPHTVNPLPGEDYMAIEFASFLIEKSKLTESESTCNFPSESLFHLNFQSRPVEYTFDILYENESDYLSRLRPVFNIIMHVTKV